jgi:hypothetical protein
MMRPYKDVDGEIDPARVKEVLSAVTKGIDVRWFNGAPDLSESPLGYKDATKVKAQIARFGLATVVGEIHPQGCIMAGEAPEPPWQRARREKRAAHKSDRRQGRSEATF